MRCRDCEVLLLQQVDGPLATPARLRVRAHVTRCAHCADLVALLASDSEAAAPDGLARVILARTTGPQAPPPDGVLLRLERDLPALAEIDPDARFLGAVMAATISVGRRRPRDRFTAWCQRLLQRPRFALEGAYVGAVALFLLLGWSGSPLAGTPRQLAAQLRSEGRAVGATLGAAIEHAGEIGQGGWAGAGRVLDAVLPDARTEASSPARLARPWRNAALGLLQGIWRAVLEPAVDWIHRAWIITWGDATGAPSPRQDSDANDNFRT